MEQEAYRHVPYDIDVEQALLGAILADNREMERASALLKPEHFYDPLHQRIFSTMSQMIERGGVVVTPGTAFGTFGEGYVRISLIAPPDRLREAIARVGKLTW